MRTRFFLLWTPLVLVVAAALPATTAAMPTFSYTVIRNECVNPDPSLPERKLIFKVSETASGPSGANKLTIDSKWQYNNASNHSWQLGGRWDQVRSTYTIDGSAHSLTLKRTQQSNGIEYLVRIKFNLRAWHQDTLLWQQTVTSIEC